MLTIITKKLSLLLVLTTFISLICTPSNAQQDILKTQHLFNKYYINPAHAGEAIQLQGSGFFGSRWSGVKNAPMSYMLSIDSSIPKYQKAGVGIIAGNQSAGPFNTILGYGDFSYAITLTSTSKLRLGLGVGLSQYSYDGRNADPGPIHDPSVARVKKSMLIPDTRLGIVYEAEKKLFLAVAADNLISPFMNYPDDPQIILPKKSTNIYVYGGYLLPVGTIANNPIIINPIVMFSSRFDNSPIWLEGVLKAIYENTISGGLSYRTYIQTQDTQYAMASSLVAFISILAIKNFDIGYAFDIGISNESLNRGSHEIYLKYSLPWPARAP